MSPHEKRVLLPEDLKPLQSLQDYKAIGGLRGLKRAEGLSPWDIIQEVKASGLRGRGGAGFPAGVKWETVYNDDCLIKYVVCNCAEGEPGTYKDRYLIDKNPYQLIEGMLIAARAISAKGAVIGIKEKFIFQVLRLQQAMEEMEQAGVMPEGFLEIVLGPDDYLFGEEKALLEVIDGHGAMPRIFPPYMMGIRTTPNEMNPTIVNNAETMSHVSHILANGADWFRSIGTEDTPGTMILTLSGDIKNPGVYEVSLGLTLHELLFDIGGGPWGKSIRAVFSGVANCVITPEIFDTPIDFGSMRDAGVGLGSGGFIVYDESKCMVRVALMFSRFLAKSSCGQCLPCNMGCNTITAHLYNLKSGKGSTKDIDAIIAECGRCTNQTRCFLPVQETKVVSSLINKFPKQFEEHAKGLCHYPAEMILPKMDHYDDEKGEFIYEAYVTEPV